MRHHSESPSEALRTRSTPHGGRRQGRALSPAETERLLSGEPIAADHGRLAELLAVVAAPPLPEEMAGYQEARGAFDRAGTDAGRGTSHEAGSRPLGVFGLRAVTVKAVGAALVLSLAGVATAAETGVLPTSVQQVAHHIFGGVGVPAPAPTSSSAGGNGTGSAPNPGIPVPTDGSAAGTTSSGTANTATTPGTAAAQAESALIGLCRTYQRVGTGGKTLDGAERKQLATAAGGEQNIDGYCRRLLSTAAAATPSPSDSSATTAVSTSQPSPDKSHPSPSGPPSHTPGGGGGNGHDHTPVPMASSTPSR